jgi:predicted DNA-binding protein (MmcQ/YjbR family)
MPLLVGATPWIFTEPPCASGKNTIKRADRNAGEVLEESGRRKDAMKVDEIRKYCLNFPDATENLQWGDDLCFKIRGKIFAIVGLDNPRLCFKCAPEVFAELIEREDIHPAPYVGRYKWVMVDRLDALAATETRELIGQSYSMVAANAPKTSKNTKKKAVKARRLPQKQSKKR